MERGDARRWDGRAGEGSRRLARRVAQQHFCSSELNFVYAWSRARGQAAIAGPRAAIYNVAFPALACVICFAQVQRGRVYCYPFLPKSFLPILAKKFTVKNASEESSMTVMRLENKQGHFRFQSKKRSPRPRL